MRVAALLLLGAAAGAASQTGSVTGTLVATGDETAGGAVVWLQGAEPPPQAGAETVLIDQRNLRFLPRVVSIGAGGTVLFRNSDPVLHNVFSPPGIGADFNLGTYPRGEARAVAFARAGAYPVLCHVHPEMVAYVVAVPSPWSAVTDPDGRYRIAGVPSGRYVLHVWHRHLRDPATPLVVVAGGTARVDLTLERTRRARGTSLTGEPQ